MDLERSPLARPFPDLPQIDGVTVRVARAGYKAWDRADLTFIELAEGTAVAGVFTTSACASSMRISPDASVWRWRRRVSRSCWR